MELIMNWDSRIEQIVREGKIYYKFWGNSNNQKLQN